MEVEFGEGGGDFEETAGVLLGLEDDLGGGELEGGGEGGRYWGGGG